VVDRLNEVADRIAVVHLGDCKTPPRDEQNRSRLGEGAIPLKGIVAALIGAGYDGFYDVELIGEDIEAADYRDLLEQSKRAFAQLIG
jgi:sugar phosphate isomerase/epimerase